jgi:hypothetical protein
MPEYRAVLSPLPREAGANVRLHGFQRSKLTKELRTMAATAFKAFNVPSMGRARVHVSWVVGCTAISNKPFYSPRDVQNAIIALKPCIDGLIDAGVIQDDSYQFLEWGSTEIVKGKVPQVIIVVEQIG